MFSTLLELAEQKHGEGTYLTFHKDDKWSIRDLEGNIIQYGETYFELLDWLHPVDLVKYDQNTEEDFTTNLGFATYPYG